MFEQIWMENTKYEEALLLNLMLNSHGSINCHKYEAKKIKLKQKWYSRYSNFFYCEIGPS